MLKKILSDIGWLILPTALSLLRKSGCYAVLAFAACAPLGLCAQSAAPFSLDDLRALAATKGPTLERAEEVEGGETFTAYVVAFRHAGLRQYALVAVPKGARPAQGLPVLIANHGFHPDPPRNGFTPEGLNWRPGNYYRSVPAAYTSAGFIVVMADYRGHNVSEGGEYTSSPKSSEYYAEDVVAMARAIGSLEHADIKNVFMWGHSMGGPITVTATLAMAQSPIVIRGASIWSTAEISEKLDQLSIPLLIQHAQGDKSAEYQNSTRLASRLKALGKTSTLYTYSGVDHFFSGAQFATAMARDVAFFRSQMAID